MKRERIVSMKALIRRLLEKWRWLLIAGLVFAVAAAGYKAFGLRHILQPGTQQESPEEAQSAEEPDAAGETEILSYDEMDLLNAAYDNRNKYISESLLFRINPEAEGRASFLLRVEVPEDGETEAAAASAAQEPAAAEQAAAGEAAAETEAEEAVSEQTLGMSVYVPRRGLGKDGQIVYVGSQNKDEALLLKSYISFITEGIDWTDLSKEFSTKPQYLQELVEVEEYVGLSGVRITVIHENAEDAQRILDHIRQNLENYAGQLRLEQGEHSLLITEEKAGTVVDFDMEEWLVNQIYSINNLYTYKTTLARSIGSGGSSGSGSGTVPMGTIAKILIKYAVFGFVMGIFLFAAVYVFFLLISGIVLSGREFNTQYGLRRLAVFPGKPRKNPIDRMIAGIDSSYLTSRDRKMCYSTAVANAKACMGGRGTIAVVSDLPAETVDSVVNRLNAAAKGSSVYFAGADIGHSAEGVNTVSAADAVVILAQCGRSRYGETGVLLETVQGTGRELLGSIVL